MSDGYMVEVVLPVFVPKDRELGASNVNDARATVRNMIESGQLRLPTTHRRGAPYELRTP